MTDKKNTAATLEDWAIGADYDNPYQAPEQRIMRLTGKVYNHPDPRFPDGKVVTTSAIDLATGKCVVTKSGTKYQLGKVSPDYDAFMKKSYPDTWDPENPNWGGKTDN